MRLAHSFLLTAVVAAAATAFMASSAFGQTVELSAEHGAHCGPVSVVNHVVAGGCEVHALSTDVPLVTIQHGATGEAVTTNCFNEFSMHLSEAGTGYIAVNDASIGPPSPTCPLTVCDEAGAAGELTHPEFPWPIQLREDPATGQLQMTMTLCIRPINNPEGSQGALCTFNIAVSEVSHQQHLEANSSPCAESGGITEVTAEWITEEVSQGDEVAIEVGHL